MKKLRLGIVLSMLFVACLTGAMAQDKPLELDAPAQNIQPTPVTIDQPAPIASLPGDYKIQEDDAMRIDVIGEPQLTAQVTVDPKGYINLQYVGQIYAEGLTQTQLVDAISKGLLKVLVDPKVSVSMVNFRKPKVQLTGQFNRPGQFEYKPGSRVMDAVALASSFTELAYLEGAALTHKDSTESIPLNLKDIYMKGNLSQNVVLQDGDTIHIPEDITNWYFVVGEVARPGRYRLKDNVTVVDAITNAVFTERARKDNVYIIRGELNGAGQKPTIDISKTEKIKCDVNDIFKNGDMSQNVSLGPGDVVYVPETKSPNWNKLSSIISAIVNLSYLPRLFGLGL